MTAGRVEKDSYPSAEPLKRGLRYSWVSRVLPGARDGLREGFFFRIVNRQKGGCLNSFGSHVKCTTGGGMHSDGADAMGSSKR
jgi:hypothetical protein